LGNGREVLERENRMLGGQLIDQGASEGMEPGADSAAFSSPLSTQQPARDPSIVNLLSS